MVTVAEQIAANAPRDPLAPLVPCGYTDVLDTVCISPEVGCPSLTPLLFVRFASLRRF